jgi:PAS domain S-box-containing protein
MLSYGVAVLSVIVAMTIVWWMESAFQAAGHVSLFLCAIMISAWFGGFRPGMLAAALAVAAFSYYLPPSYSFAVEARELPRLLLFVLSALLVGSLTSAQRSAAESLRHARDSLQEAFQQLKKTNDALQAENLERKRAEEKLREQARLLDLTHDTVFVRDRDDVITYWNRGAEEQYGWKRTEAIGKVSHQLRQTIFPAPLEEINAELLRTGRWEGELIHTKRDGTQVIVASRWSLQRSEQGEVAAILETNNDITERKQAEEALQKVQMELAHITRVTTLGELAASIAHEINQPLSGIVINGNASLRWLAFDPPNLDEAREAVERIVRDGKRAGEIITRIRKLLQKTETEKESLDINDAILEVTALTQSEIRKYKVMLRTHLASDLPPVLGDRVQLQQVLLNLVMNGTEAMRSLEDRPRELVIRTERNGIDQVCVSVHDSGLGLDTKNIQKIFDAFYTTKAGGMGMGLAISRSIVENHGGRLWAEPNNGPGATFMFTLLRCSSERQ